MNLKHRNYRTKRKYFTFLGCKKAGEKNEKKFANQLGDTMPTSIYFTNYRLLFTGILSCRHSKNFRKFVETPAGGELYQ